MQQSFQPEQENSTDTSLAEYREQRVLQLEGEIQRQYANLANAALALGVALKTFRDEKLWQVDGWHSMTHYASVRWPNLSKQRLTQLLQSADIYEEIEEYNQQERVNESFTKLPLPETEYAARALAHTPEDDRISTYQRAVEAAGGEAPTAQQITAARVATIDTDRKPKSLPASDDEPKPIKRRGFTATAIDYNRKCILGFYYYPPSHRFPDPKRVNIWIDFDTLEAVGCVMPTFDEVKEWKESGGLSPDVAIYLKEKIDKAKENAARMEPEQKSFMPEGADAYDPTASFFQDYPQ